MYHTGTDDPGQAAKSAEPLIPYLSILQSTCKVTHHQPPNKVSKEFSTYTHSKKAGIKYESTSSSTELRASGGAEYLTSNKYHWLDHRPSQSSQRNAIGHNIISGTRPVIGEVSR
jgi:hypothetical protein